MSEAMRFGGYLDKSGIDTRSGINVLQAVVVTGLLNDVKDRREETLTDKKKKCNKIDVIYIGEQISSLRKIQHSAGFQFERHPITPI